MRKATEATAAGGCDPSGGVRCGRAGGHTATEATAAVVEHRGKEARRHSKKQNFHKRGWGIMNKLS